MNFSYWPQFKSTAIALAVSTALVGCSDDDSSSKAAPETPTPPPTVEPKPNTAPTLSVSAPELRSEGSTVSIVLITEDAEGDELAISVKQVSGETVFIGKESANTFSFRAPNVDVETALVFEAKVNDGHNAEVVKQITVTIYPTGAKPTVFVSENAQIEGGSTHELMGRAQDDGEVVSLVWQQKVVADEEIVELTATEEGKASFTAPLLGHVDPVAFTFELIATDDQGFETREPHVVTVLPAAPEATGNADMGLHAGGVELALPLVVNSYAKGEDLTFTWQQVSGDPAIWLQDLDKQTAKAVMPYTSEEVEVVVRGTVTDPFGRSSSADFTFRVEPTERPFVKTDLVLNDTGATTCANDPRSKIWVPIPGGGLVDTGHDNLIDCAELSQIDGENEYPIPRGQDGHSGRDVEAANGTLVKVGSGRAGFDFTKLDSAGQPLPVTAQSWDCVKDNHTGLIWQVKPDEVGLHDRLNTYTWYNPNPLTNGGNAGKQGGGICEGSACDTLAYVEKTNELGYCGINNWSLPTWYQLISIVDFGALKDTPMIDSDFFPDVPSNNSGYRNVTFWTSQATRGQYLLDWNINRVVKVFNFYGGLPNHFKDDSNYIRLVAKPADTAEQGAE